MVKDYTVVSLIPDDAHRAASESDYAGEAVQFPYQGYVPGVGSRVSSFSHRDKAGRYMNEHAAPTDDQKYRRVINGCVSRIEYVSEERGRWAGEHHWVHYINVYVSEDED